MAPKRTTLLIVILTIVIGGVFVRSQITEKEVVTYEERQQEIQRLSEENDKKKKHASMYSLPIFYEGIEQYSYKKNISGPVRGGIVSHHLLAKDSIAKFFAEFRGQEIETVVLIGPNHFSIGDSMISTTLNDYSTPYGNLTVNEGVINKLLESKVVAQEELQFDHEHSISSLVPYIKFNFPKAKMVPIALRYETSRVQLDDFVEKLHEVIPENSIVISSVDFSHHLNRFATELHDEASVSAIKDFDLDRVFNLEIDSPPSIYVLLKYMYEIGAQKISYENLNSTDFTGNLGTEDATSYVFAHFTNGEKEKVKTVATSLHFGDMMFDRGVRQKILKGVDPFEYIKGVEGNFLKGVDLTIGNLEGPIAEVKNCSYEKEIAFNFDPGIASLLKKYNFSGVTLANNHSFDCGRKGYSDTVEVLNEQGIFSFGTQLELGYVIKEVGTEKIAIVGVNETGRYQEDFNDVEELLIELKEKVDSVIVHIHWGYEYNTTSSDIQKSIAHRFVDAGAQVIIGHHPHVIQEVEQYNGATIFYSLGNFIFDQHMPNTTTGIAVGLVHEGGVKKGVIFPYDIVKYQPKLMSYEETKAFCDGFLKNINRETECGFVQ